MFAHMSAFFRNDRSIMTSKSAFIKARIFGKPFQSIRDSQRDSQRQAEK